ncbi:hypothetical protein ES703_103937 [subsurface metagenome]
MKIKRFFKQYWIPIIGACVAILAAWSPFLLWPSNLPSINWGRAQVVLSAIAFPAIFSALYLTMVQLRKAMAKPSIKVAFNKEGEQKATLTYKDGNLEAGLPILWIINEGNAVARFFQIDFFIPENIVRSGVYVPLRKHDGNYILSYTNEGRYTLWVNRPYQDTNMIFSSAFGINKLLDEFKDGFEIEYKIYGDWAETQEGKLKVIIKKQEVTPHAST